MKKDTGAFFNNPKKFSKTTTGIGPFINSEGDVVTNPTTIADMLKNQ